MMDAPPPFARDRQWQLRVSRAPSYSHRVVWHDPTDEYEYEPQGRGLELTHTAEGGVWLQIDWRRDAQRCVSGLTGAVFTHPHHAPASAWQPAAWRATRRVWTSRQAALVIPQQYDALTPGTRVQLLAPSPRFHLLGAGEDYEPSHDVEPRGTGTVVESAWFAGYYFVRLDDLASLRPILNSTASTSQLIEHPANLSTLAPDHVHFTPPDVDWTRAASQRHQAQSRKGALAAVPNTATQTPTIRTDQ